MPNPFIRKLDNFEKLLKADREALLNASEAVETFRARSILIQEGERPRGAYVVLKGFACRYKILGEGERQIVDFVVPGDMCDGYHFVPRGIDHSISTLSASEIALINHRRFLAITQEFPRIARALWYSSLIEEAILREWVANVGRRPADMRIANLLSELFVRLTVVREAKANAFDLPVSQIDLADATALSTVHVNRILRRLREKQILTVERGSVHVRDAARLMKFAKFNANYLRFNQQNNKTLA